MNDLILLSTFIAAGFSLLYQLFGATRRGRDSHHHDERWRRSWTSRLILRAGTFALVTSAGVCAQPMDSFESTERARSAPVFTIYFENDTFAGTDEHYTSGVKLSWLSADLVDWGQSGWR